MEKGDSNEAAFIFEIMNDILMIIIILRGIKSFCHKS